MAVYKIKGVFEFGKDFRDIRREGGADVFVKCGM
jgi:hypothetical protein